LLECWTQDLTMIHGLGRTSGSGTGAEAGVISACLNCPFCDDCDRGSDGHRFHDMNSFQTFVVWQSFEKSILLSFE
jgi:hypothetical protein